MGLGGASTRRPNKGTGLVRTAGSRLSGSESWWRIRTWGALVVRRSAESVRGWTRLVGEWGPDEAGRRFAWRRFWDRRSMDFVTEAFGGFVLWWPFFGAGEFEFVAGRDAGPMGAWPGCCRPDCQTRRRQLDSSEGCWLNKVASIYPLGLRDDPSVAVTNRDSRRAVGLICWDSD